MLACVLALGLVAAAAVGTMAAQADPNAPPDPKLEQEYTELQAKADQQSGSKKAETMAKLAEMDYTFAEAGFAHGQPDAAQHHLERAAHWADQAMDFFRTEAAAGKTNGMKNVEIAFQKITYGLGGLAQQVHLRERPKVQAVDNHFAQLRGQLLDFMFAPKKK